MIGPTFSLYPHNCHSSIAHLQNVLRQISSWMSANLLTLNSSKMNFSLLVTKSKCLKHWTHYSSQLYTSNVKRLTWFSLNFTPSLPANGFNGLPTISNFMYVPVPLFMNIHMKTAQLPRHLLLARSVSKARFRRVMWNDVIPNADKNAATPPSVATSKHCPVTVTCIRGSPVNAF